MKILAALFALLFAGASFAQAEAVPESVTRPSPETLGVDPENILNLDLSTGGRVVVIMRPDIAPNHVERVKTLTREGFYDGLLFHRVIPGFMAQTGDPLGTGAGGSDLPDLEPEFTRTPHLRGTVSMARTSEPNTANSQFFIVYMPTPQLDENYTAWGRVYSGMEFVDTIAPGEPPQNPSSIIKASIEADRVPPPDFAALTAARTPSSTELPSGPIGLDAAAPPAPGTDLPEGGALADEAALEAAVETLPDEGTGQAAERAAEPQ